VSTAFSWLSNGQHPSSWSEQPIWGNSVTVPIESVAIAKLMLVQLPVRRGRFPLKAAVAIEVPNVTMGLTGPVITETKELGPIPTSMDTAELDMVEACVGAKPDPCEPRMIELVSPSGEQPTKEGAVSLTVAHSWMLNNIASARLSDLLLSPRGASVHTLLV